MFQGFRWWHLLVLLLYCLIASYIFFCWCLKICGDDGAAAKYEENVPVVTEPLVFNTNDTLAIQKEPFPGYRSGIMASHGKDSILQIVGYYTAEEGAEVGLARARAVQRLFPNVPDSLVERRTSKVPSLEKVADGEFVASEVNWLAPRPPAEAEAPEPEIRVENLNGTQLIYFPTNSDRKLANSAVDTYLDQVAERVKITSERIELTGHTDDRNTNEYNQALGQRRADKVKQLLVAKGVDAGLISAESKGETEPTATNATADGQQLNRRVELRLIKTQ